MRATAIDHPPSKAERRNFQRVRVKIYGRFMLEDRTEHPCQVVDMSPGNVALRCERIGEPGEKVIAYIDHIGRVEGVVTRTLQDGFAMTVVASDRKKDKLAAQLTWLANKHELDLPEDRRHERVAPRNPLSTLQLSDGRQYSSAASSICRFRAPRSRSTSSRRSASRLPSAPCAARSCVTSRMASPSNSP